MTQQFTASEVHERERFEEWYTTHACSYSRDPIGSRDCSLQWESWKAARADLLEAREKAVPVAYALFTEKGLIRMWSRDWFADAHGTPINPTPLYTHPAPSDAERLAEALRTIQHSMQQAQIPGNDSRREIKLSASVCEQALAAHSAKAQPPAASVTVDAVMRVIDGQRRLPYCSIDEKQAFRNELEAALAAQGNPNEV